MRLLWHGFQPIILRKTFKMYYNFDACNYFIKELNIFVYSKADTTQTKGILDLGGASTQIVFVPKSN